MQTAVERDTGSEVTAGRQAEGDLSKGGNWEAARRTRLTEAVGAGGEGGVHCVVLRELGHAATGRACFGGEDGGICDGVGVGVGFNSSGRHRQGEPIGTVAWARAGLSDRAEAQGRAVCWAAAGRAGAREAQYVSDSRRFGVSRQLSRAIWNCCVWRERSWRRAVLSGLTRRCLRRCARGEGVPVRGFAGGKPVQEHLRVHAAAEAAKGACRLRPLDTREMPSDSSQLPP